MTPEGRPVIAVLRALALGDLLCAVPTLRELRRRHPDAWVVLIGLPWAATLVDRFPTLIDEHLAFPGFPGLPELPVDPARVTAFLASIQDRSIDLAVGLQGSGLASNAFLQLLGARRLAGFHPPGVPPPADGDWVPFRPHGHEAERLLRVAPVLGGEAATPAGDPSPALEFPVRSADWADLERVPGAGRLVPGGYAVVHAGANGPDRRWPVDRFARVARSLVDDGLTVVLTGTAGEASLTGAIAAALPHGSCLDLAGRTGLGTLAALVDGARLVVTNDTGVSHVAAARRVPSVVVFTGSERERWAPLDGVRHVAVGDGLPNGCGEHAAAARHRCLGDACAARPAQAAWGPPRIPSVGLVRQAVRGQLEAQRAATA